MTTRDLIKTVGESFADDTVNHQMAVLRDDGLYRHLRFADPTNGLSWFDLVTWPRALTINGCHGTYTYTRSDDMFAFFRQSNGVNVDYWAEKLPGGRDSVKVFDEDVFVEAAAEEIAQYEQRFPQLLHAYETARPLFDATPANERWPFKRDGMREPRKPVDPADLRDQLREARDDGDTGHEDSARAFLRHWESQGVVSDTWEWDLRAYDFHFVWSCHAIRAGIAMYDGARVRRVETVAAL
jgi:hypothetical protein